ncbi:MAG: PTS system mannose/fructose/sorbose family transporter subunit IID [Floccifex porci]|uniref:PTS system mannose/fructose/sorbose family transporter subunit IID n=1 Tax=Floccifex porci TaxID=2606629 RepID=UPI0023F532ED|nr:PTS system mannose/fructose/sorbose family transporter subunit IID [Floccifex porci]MCI7802088.1 PTS system mannose/fructose/sorbose family transporter subunit IID [Erysipelotrichaceae bacterium]MDD7466542.1 PTS system mannose/fructose/sorbose family transporter subunit IID [Floccifex porci]MDY4796582.1 PTS system mannose/fructose/sorbose family transporter subunit IID [Floccifex porci]
MKKVSKKTLNSSFWRWWYGNLTCFSHEHMQTFGYMWSMLPIIKELYPTHEEQCEKMQTYYPFFNTEPQIGCIVVGITAGLEEARANGADGIDDEMINGIRAGLMGPLAGIGDSLIVGTYIPILLGIALGFAEGGSAIGPIFYIVVWNATSIWFQHYIYFLGYNLGGSAVELLVGDRATAFRNAVITMGQVIVGAMAASWVAISTNIVIAQDSTGADITLGSKLDGAFPKLLTCVFVLFCWWLMAKKGMSPVKCLLLMVVIGFVGSVIGLLG